MLLLLLTLSISNGCGLVWIFGHFCYDPIRVCSSKVRSIQLLVRCLNYCRFVISWSMMRGLGRICWAILRCAVEGLTRSLFSLDSESVVGCSLTTGAPAGTECFSMMSIPFWSSWKRPAAQEFKLTFVSTWLISPQSISLSYLRSISR